MLLGKESNPPLVPRLSLNQNQRYHTRRCNQNNTLNYSKKADAQIASASFCLNLEKTIQRPVQFPFVYCA